MFDVLKADGPPYKFRIAAVPLAYLQQVFDWLRRHGAAGTWRTATYVDIGGLFDMQVWTNDPDDAALFEARWA